jgi:hypothetical protein
LTAVSSTGSGLVVHWVGRYRESILFGWIVWAVGLGLLSTLDKHSGLGKQIGYGILTGVGVGNTLQPYVSARNHQFGHLAYLYIALSLPFKLALKDATWPW